MCRLQKKSILLHSLMGLWFLAGGLVLEDSVGQGIGIDPKGGTPTPQEQAYIDDFNFYWMGLDQIPSEVPTLEEYARPETYDIRHLGNVINVWVNRIVGRQNLDADMAWGSSYHTHSLNDMYRGTGDRKYLDANLRIVRASLANRDDKKGHTTFFGEMAPGWGTAYYAGRHVIHPVHTGMIAFGIVEFLELVQQEPELMTDLGDEFDTMVEEITETIDWHDRQWSDGPGEDEGYYFTKDNEPQYEGDPLAANRLSAMGLALWGSWKATGNTEHREKALRLARYMKRRMRLYAEGPYGDGAYFWKTFLFVQPIEFALPASHVSSLNGGEDFSHAALTIAFPLTLGLEGEVFSEYDMQAFARSILLGCARLGDGVLLGNIVGTTIFGPSQVLIPGYLFRIAPHSPEAFDAVAEFLLRYQKNPRNVDIAQLIRFRPNVDQPSASHWSVW